MAHRGETPTIVIVQGTVPGYRIPFVEQLRRIPHLHAVVAAGTEYFDPSVRLAETWHPDVQLTNRYLLRRRLLVQRGIRTATRHADLVVAELNPRVISTWAVLAARRLRRRPMLLWGHFHNRTAPPRHGLGRAAMTGLASGVIAYTDADAERFRRRAPRRAHRVHVAPNSTNLAADASVVVDRPRVRLLTVGRLVEDKGIALLADALARARSRDPALQDVVLTVVGDGPQREHLEMLASDADWIDLRAGTYDHRILDDLYGESIAAACGGYVGLNLVQSLLHGVPFLYRADAAHSPEVALADESNSISFTGEDPEAVATAISEIVRRQRAGRYRPDAIRRSCEHHTIEGMVTGFVAACVAAMRPPTRTPR